MTETAFRNSPSSETELMDHAAELSGLTISQLADRLNCVLPNNPSQSKGWTGEIVERFLGATAASLPEPDFQQIGIELKTIPIKNNGNPAESTYVCTVPLVNVSGLTWKRHWLEKNYHAFSGSLLKVKNQLNSPCAVLVTLYSGHQMWFRKTI